MLVSILVGLVAAVINSGIISLHSPHLRLHNLRVSAATTQIEVDPPSGTPSLAYGRANYPFDIQTFIKRTELLGRIIVSPPVLTRMAAGCGVPADQLSGLARVTADVPDDLTQPNSEQRASDIAATLTRDRIEVQARPTVPVIDVYAQSSSVGEAECLANAAAPALTRYLQTLARAQNSSAPVVSLRPLGPARGAPVDSGSTEVIAFLTFLTAFALCLAGLRAIAWLRRRQRGELPAGEELEEDAAESIDDPGARRSSDSWPHTTRVLPWMLAVFIAVVWLTPFNDISLNIKLPIELRLDRLVLPLVTVFWLLSFAAGGRWRPRLRLTWIHVALAALVACAFLSVVTDARYLDHTLEFQLALKKLPLLVAYVTLFVIAASAVRRNEVNPFLSYTLALAVIVAIEMIYEYRTKQNLFWTYEQKLLPSSFSLDLSSGTSAVDYAGRPLVRGPAETPVEAVGMLAMALPIAVVRILQSDRWRPRIMYGIITALIFAAMFATYRKTTLLAPVSVIVTIGFFRRREILKLAPLGMVLLATVSALSPGAIGSTVNQFTGAGAAAAPTVSSRTSDYDAIRPDVLSHLLFGRGWGTYDHLTYRILDSQILTTTIEGGILGLIAFVAVPIVVLWVSRRTIALRDSEASPIALIGACVASVFLVLAFLFDELSFPHPVYVFLYMVGLVTVILRKQVQQPSERPPSLPPPDPLPELEWPEFALAEASGVAER
jgi:hypothetical protein